MASPPALQCVSTPCRPAAARRRAGRSPGTSRGLPSWIARASASRAAAISAGEPRAAVVRHDAFHPVQGPEQVDGRRPAGGQVVASPPPAAQERASRRSRGRPAGPGTRRRRPRCRWPAPRGPAARESPPRRSRTSRQSISTNSVGSRVWSISSRCPSTSPTQRRVSYFDDGDMKSFVSVVWDIWSFDLFRIPGFGLEISDLLRGLRLVLCQGSELGCHWLCQCCLIRLLALKHWRSQWHPSLNQALTKH